jgi:hypothetical protein
MKIVASAIMIGSGLIGMGTAQPHPGGLIAFFGGLILCITGIVLCIKNWNAPSDR